jgi:hypothetical protein
MEEFVLCIKMAVSEAYFLAAVRLHLVLHSACCGCNEFALDSAFCLFLTTVRLHWVLQSACFWLRYFRIGLCILPVSGCGTLALGSAFCLFLAAVRLHQVLHSACFWLRYVYNGFSILPVFGCGTLASGPAFLLLLAMVRLHNVWVLAVLVDSWSALPTQKAAAEAEVFGTACKTAGLIIGAAFLHVC